MHEEGIRIAQEARRVVVACACGLLALFAGLAAMAALGGPPPGDRAYAASDIPSKVRFNHGHKVWYGATASGNSQGRETHTYHVYYDVDGKEVKEWAYCSIPSKNWIDAVEHPTTPIAGGSVKVDDAQDLAMVLYYGYGGPGFDEAMWPDDYFDGTAMNKEDRYGESAWYDKYYAMTHLLVSDRAFGDDKETLDECSDAFTKWFAWKIQGNKHWATKYAGKDEANPNSVYNKMKQAWSELSDAFKSDYTSRCYAINPHAWGDTGAQIFMVASKYELKLGAISLEKTSARKALSNDNACYSLKGALYGVYDSKEKALKRKEEKAIATFKTNAEGTWASDEVFEVGTYYVAEIAPSAGFALDEEVYEVAVKAGRTVRVNGGAGSKEPPISAPAAILLAKRDEAAGEHAQGQATLAGAEFQVSFFAGHYTASNLPATPARSWVLKTDASGAIDLRNADAHKVAGDGLYHDSAGQVVFPLGTVSIVETKAPSGYVLDRSDGGKPKTYVFQIVEDSSAASGAAVKPLNYTETVAGSNAPIVPNAVVRGDFRLVKEASTEVREDAPQEQKRILVEGVRFQILNDNDAAVVSPQTGESVAKGGVVCEIVTDEGGLASTRAGAAVNGWALPKGWTGALAYGTYAVHEVIPDDVRKKFRETYKADLFAVDDWKITIAGEGQYDPPMLVNNTIAQMALSIVKVDAETGERIAAPVSFQLFDAAGELVTYTSQYPERITVDTWTANEKGELTLPMLLPGGSYTLAEVEAPWGYVLTPDTVAFTVDDYRGWNDPLVVTLSNQPVKGVIEVVKTAADTGEALAGARYEVAAASDVVTPDGTLRVPAGEVVATLETDANGTARTPELYVGSYTVRETAAPAGYALDLEEHVVAVEPEGQDTPVVEVRAELVDAPTTVRLKKTDAQSGLPLAGAVLRVWRSGEAQGGADGSFDVEVETGEDGFAELKHLKPGVYHVAELEAPAGYHVPEAGGSVDFEVDANGLIGYAGAARSDTLEIVLENEPNELGTHASVNGDQVAVIADSVQLVDNVWYKGCVPGRSYTVEGTLHLVERAEDGSNTDAGPLMHADGSPVTAQTTFTAAQVEGEVEVVFTFDASMLAGRKVVAFEEMSCAGVYFGEHADIQDEDQAVYFSPEISTELVDEEEGSHAVEAAQAIRLVDTVSYRGLVAGQEYRIVGTLMDKTKRAALTDARGSTVTTQATFTPEAGEGSVEVAYELDASTLAGCDAVAFEKVYCDDKEVISHEDYEAASQTVRFRSPQPPAEDTPPEDYPPASPSPTPPAQLPQTGDVLRLAALAAALVAALSGAALAIARRVRRSR